MSKFMIENAQIAKASSFQPLVQGDTPEIVNIASTLGKVAEYHDEIERTNNILSDLVDTTDGPRVKIRGTLPKLSFAQTTTGSEYDNDNCGIITYPGNVNGTNMTIQSGGNMIIGSGEYPTNWYNLANKSSSWPDYWTNDGEQLYIGSDNYVMIHTNASTIANRKTFTFGTNFNLALGAAIQFRTNTAENPIVSALTTAATTTSRMWTLPDATGTLALAGDHVLKTGDTMSGNLTVAKTSGDTYCIIHRTDTDTKVGVGVGTGGTNHGIYSFKLNKWMVYGDASNVYLNGNASTADKLNTNAGDVFSPIYFANGVPVECNIPTSGSWKNGVPIIGADGVMEVSKYIDFHASVTSTNDYDVRISCDENYLTVKSNATSNGAGINPSTNNVYNLGTSSLKWKNIYATTFTGSLSGNASTATKVYSTLTNPSSATTYHIPFHSGATSGNKSLYTNNGIKYVTFEGTTTTNGSSMLELGNSTASGKAGNKQGFICMYGSGTGSITITPNSSSTYNSAFIPAADGNFPLYTVLYTSTTAPSATNVTINLNSSKTIIGVYDYLDIWVYVGATSRLAYIKLPTFTSALSQAPIYFQTATSYTTKYVYLGSNGYTLNFTTAGSSDSTKCSFAKVVGVRFT